MTLISRYSMLRKICVLISILILVPLGAQIKTGISSGPYLPPNYVDGVLVVVGNKVILRSEFETEKVQLARGTVLKDSQKQYCNLLEELIIQKLLLSQAEIDSLPLTDDQIEAEIDSRLRYFQRQAGSQAELEKYIGKTIPEYKEMMRPKMREQLLAQEMRNIITGVVKISPQEVKSFYDHIPQDSLPIISTEIEVAQLMIEPHISGESKAFAKAQLNDIRNRVIRGESFEKLARTYSMDPGSKAQSGLLPEFGRGEMVPAFERMAYKMKPDSISPVFESDFGFHLMKLIKRKGERIIAAHILIRPENTSDDYSTAMMRVDSVFQMLNDGKIKWCDAVKKYGTEDKTNRMTKGNCGFLVDEVTGLQKTIYENLSADVKKELDKLKPGQFSQPALSTTLDGRTVYRIIYLQTFIAPHQANLIQDYSRIQLEADAKKKGDAVSKWVEKYRRKTYIRIKDRDFVCDQLNNWENE